MVPSSMSICKAWQFSPSNIIQSCFQLFFGVIFTLSVNVSGVEEVTCSNVKCFPLFSFAWGSEGELWVSQWGVLLFDAIVVFLRGNLSVYNLNLKTNQPQTAYFLVVLHLWSSNVWFSTWQLTMGGSFLPITDKTLISRHYLLQVAPNLPSCMTV